MNYDDLPSMKAWDELSCVNGEGSDAWTSLMAKFQHTGCPGLQMEDICAHDAVECAVKGRCRKSYEKLYDRQLRIKANKDITPSERMCIECGKRPVEVIDDYVSDNCGSCNDKLIQRANENAEWRYYHQ